MEISLQIKKYRSDMNLSQEELAEKIYVSRQTISNWETGKNYPDIHSLLLLSSLFNVSLDQLMKGDVEMMKEEIKKTEMEKLNRYGAVFSILFIATIVSAVPLAVWLGFYAFIPWGLLFGVTMFFACRTEQIKKSNHLRTYKEIVAFAEGRRLDELETQQETGKHPYQRFLLVVGSGLVALIVCLVLAWSFLHGVEKLHEGTRRLYFRPQRGESTVNIVLNRPYDYNTNAVVKIGCSKTKIRSYIPE